MTQAYGTELRKLGGILCFRDQGEEGGGVSSWKATSTKEVLDSSNNIIRYDLPTMSKKVPRESIRAWGTVRREMENCSRKRL